MTIKTILVCLTTTTNVERVEQGGQLSGTKIPRSNHWSAHTSIHRDIPQHRS